jgi:cytochrome c biogenesis protein CcmG, thiol:disulfide interchange protein DsbE
MVYLSMRYLLPLILLLFLLFFLWQGLVRDPMQIPSPLIDKAIPSFVAMPLESSSKKLTEKIFLGHCSLLVVWSSWCMSCQAEQDFLLTLKKNTQLKLIGLDYRDDFDAANLWLKRYGNPYGNVIFDGKGLLGIDLGVYGVPESFLIDSKGIVRYKHIGPLSEAIWDKEVRPLLNRYGKTYG